MTRNEPLRNLATPFVLSVLTFATVVIQLAITGVHLESLHYGWIGAGFLVGVPLAAHDLTRNAPAVTAPRVLGASIVILVGSGLGFYSLSLSMLSVVDLLSATVGIATAALVVSIPHLVYS